MLPPMPPPRPLRAPLRVSALLATCGWLVTGCCWLVALFVPWTTRGLLSSASLIDAVRLIGRGVVASVVPPAAAWLLLVPTIAAIGLLALSGFRGRWVLVGQVLLAVIGTVLSLGIGWRLTDGDIGKAGPGLWLSLLGALFAVAAVVLAVVDLRVARRSTPVVPVAWTG